MNWKSGCVVYGRMIPFVLIILFFCSPVILVDFLVGSESIFSLREEASRWLEIVNGLLFLILLPLGLSFASKATGQFLTPNKSQL